MNPHYSGEKETDDFLKSFALAVIAIGQLEWILEVAVADHIIDPKFKSSFNPSEDEIKEFKQEFNKILKLTLGGKVCILKKFIKDENIISQLEYINEKRILLIHSAWSQDENGKIGTERMREDFKYYKISEINDLCEKTIILTKKLQDIYFEGKC